jgi:hypothetical protein
MLIINPSFAVDLKSDTKKASRKTLKSLRLALLYWTFWTSFLNFAVSEPKSLYITLSKEKKYHYFGLAAKPAAKRN